MNVFFFFDVVPGDFSLFLVEASGLDFQVGLPLAADLIFEQEDMRELP